MIYFAKIFAIQHTDQTQAKIIVPNIVIRVRKQLSEDQKRMLNKKYNLQYDIITIYTLEKKEESK